MKNITISPISISEFDIFDTSSQSFAFTNLITSLSSLYDNSTHYVGEIRCSKVSTDYNVWKLLFAIALFLQGIIYVFFGYRFFKAVTFFIGFNLAAILLCMLCYEFNWLLLPHGRLALTIGVGILCGICTLSLSYVGLFLIGFNFGALSAVLCVIVLEYFVDIYSIWISIGVVVVSGLCLAIVCFKFNKCMIIFGTSFLGGAHISISLDYIIEQADMLQFAWHLFKQVQVSTGVCWYSWIIFSCWFLWFAVGIVVQYSFTSKGIDHNELMQCKKCMCIARMRCKNKRDTQSVRYRYLYQVRRVTGDIISQQCLQNAEGKLLPSGHSLTRSRRLVPTFDSQASHLTQIVSDRIL